MFCNKYNNGCTRLFNLDRWGIIRILATITAIIYSVYRWMITYEWTLSIQRQILIPISLRPWDINWFYLIMIQGMIKFIARPKVITHLTKSSSPWQLHLVLMVLLEPMVSLEQIVTQVPLESTVQLEPMVPTEERGNFTSRHFTPRHFTSGQFTLHHFTPGNESNIEYSQIQ